jgi:hypothetical protein
MERCSSLFAWSLCCTSFLRLQITSLASSNFSSGVIRLICPLRLA